MIHIHIQIRKRRTRGKKKCAWRMKETRKKNELKTRYSLSCRHNIKTRISPRVILIQSNFLTFRCRPLIFFFAHIIYLFFLTVTCLHKGNLILSFTHNNMNLRWNGCNGFLSLTTNKIIIIIQCWDWKKKIIVK